MKKFTRDYTSVLKKLAKRAYYGISKTAPVGKKRRKR